MGLFSASPDEIESIRGVSNLNIANMTDQKLILIALAVLMEGVGIADEDLIRELKRRSLRKDWNDHH